MNFWTLIGRPFGRRCWHSFKLFLTSGRLGQVGLTVSLLYLVGMTSGRKYSIYTGVFYGLIFPLIPLLERVSPSGPCNPGMGVLFFFLALVIALVALVVSLVGFFRGKRSFKGPVLINSLALAGMIGFIYMGY